MLEESNDTLGAKEVNETDTTGVVKLEGTANTTDSTRKPNVQNVRMNRKDRRILGRILRSKALNKDLMNLKLKTGKDLFTSICESTHKIGHIHKIHSIIFGK